MQKENKSISIGKLGMNRDAHPSNLKETEYSFAMNANIEDSSGNGFPNIQNEPSNILCAKFNNNWKVIGFKKDLNADKTYFFLHNPTTGESEIGSIDTINNITDVEDIAASCGCDIRKILNEPLEDQDQQTTCTYNTIVNDSCNLCLNFSLDYPIRDPQLKDESCGKRLYWTDCNNPPRYIDLDNLDQYGEIGIKTCDTDTLVATCLDCEKLRIFPCFEIPCMTPVAIQLGGNLKAGTYEFLLAYSDKQGNEISEYYSITNPVSIFDEHNTIIDQTETADRTNLGIRLVVENLDQKFGYYKVAVIQRADVNEATSYFIEGIHPTTDNTVVYTTEIDKERTTLQNLAAEKSFYNKSCHMASSNGYLFQAGLEAEKEYNLQPIANLMGSFVRWMTVQTDEDLYKDGINTSLYKGYLRNETYPLAIRFTGDCGYITALYPLVGRTATTRELDILHNGTTGTTPDVNSTYRTTKACYKTDRKFRWQYEPTASELGDCPQQAGGGTTVTKTVEKCCNVPDVFVIEAGTYNIPDTANYSDLITFINDNLTDICDPASPLFDADICNALSGVYAGTCTPNFAPLVCTASVQSSLTVVAGSVATTATDPEEKDLADYVRLVEPTSCSAYVQPLSTDTTFIGNCMNTGDDVYERNALGSMLLCTSAANLPVVNSPQVPTPNAFYLGYECGNTIPDLQDTRGSVANGNFTTKLHKGAIWNRMDFNTRPNMLLEITKQTLCSNTDDVVTGTLVRVSVYDSCAATVPVYTEIVDLSVGTIIDLQAGNYAGNSVYIAVDAPIVQTNGISFHTSPPCGCFGMADREIEFDSIEISYTNLSFAKRICHTANCDYTVPDSVGCTPVPHKYGKFSYTESTEIYADNEELFNSRTLDIKRSDLPVDIRQEFEDAFVDAVGNGNNYLLNEATDLRCKPIRHFKMPCGSLVPIIGTNPLLPFQKATIYPLGVTINPTVVNAFLNIAVNNGLITQEQRDAITGYEIFRGDRSIHKSVLSKGLLYDMYSYEEDGDNVLYANYPYNDLGPDDLHFEDDGRNNLIQHPTGGVSNTRWTYHSPEVHFSKPQLGTEMKLEGYMFGSSRGHYVAVEAHPKWVILTQQARNTATALALAEVVFEMLVVGGEWVSNLSGTSIGGAAFAVATVAAILILVASGAIKVGKLRYEWLKVIKDNGQMRNFAYYYTSEGNYNFYAPNVDVGNNMLRGLSAAKYIKDGRQRVVESDTGIGIKVNHVDRESAVFLSTNDVALNYDPVYSTYDNSRHISSNVGGCQNTKSREIESNIASPYVSIENFVPNQYGTLDGVKWLSTSSCNSLDTVEECKPIFGGDTFLSRFSLKRKIPMFHTTAMSQANLIPFNYSFYNNVGYARFYVDYETNDDNHSGGLGLIFPNIKSELNVDCKNEVGFYYKEPSRFYLYYYGIPQFIVESEINVNYRYAKKEPHERFYPNIGDYVRWTQETVVSIRRDNTYYYNNTYSKNVTQTATRTLPSTYEKELYDCKYNQPNAVIYSVQDNSEQELTDPWLTYRPLDKYQFPTSSGRLIDLRDIESTQVLGRFENEAILFNSVDQLRERLTAQTESLGTGGIFAQRPLSFAKTDIGYAGTQHKAMISCEFGHFWVDALRGQVFKVNQSGKNLVEISAFNEGGQPSGMRNWFKEHLPFKILRGNIDNLTTNDLDNSYKGLGITMGWDSRFRRVFITKKDYRIVHEFVGQLEYVDKEFRIKATSEVIELGDPTYFEACHFTVGYSPIAQTWLSYYGFNPDYYISHNNYFQTGLNTSRDDTENGLWSHLLTNKSFQVFYGKRHPFTLELPTKNDYANKILKSIEYWTDTRRYHNEYDFAEYRRLAFNKGWLYNNSQNSGELNFVVQEKNNLRQTVEYPKTIANRATEVLITESDKKWTLNSFYNRVKNEQNNVPLWTKDCNDINQSITVGTLDYRQGFKDRLRGDWFLTRLTNDAESRYKIIFKWMNNKETLYTS